jgi:prepilin-type N-terminal cleavage/methylation domain-containing protein
MAFKKSKTELSLKAFFVLGQVLQTVKMLRNIKGRRGKKGFTLVELMVVAIILGVLAVLSIPLYAGYVRRAKISEALLTISDIKHGVVSYYQKNSTFAVATDADAISDTYGVAVDETKWTYRVKATGEIEVRASSVGSGLDTGKISAIPTIQPNGSISWDITADGNKIKQDEVS